MSERQLRPLRAKEVRQLRAVLAFAVLSHVLDLITTQFRDPLLENEGNPFYLLAEHLGFSGWPWLVSTKVVFVGALGLAYWWYLGIRPLFLPAQEVRHVRALIWHGLWNGHARGRWEQLGQARTLRFLGMILAAISLPCSGAAALFISIDNVLSALRRPLPMMFVNASLLCISFFVFLWWLFEYWHFYKTEIRSPSRAEVEKAAKTL